MNALMANANEQRSHILQKKKNSPKTFPHTSKRQFNGDTYKVVSSYNSLYNDMGYKPTILLSSIYEYICVYEIPRG